MDIKGYTKNWNARVRQWRYLFIILLCVSFLLVVTILALVGVEKNNVDRYRVENYERFQENIDAFSDVISGTDDLCENLTITAYVLPYFQQTGYEEFKSQLIESNIGIVEGRGLFVYDSMGYKMMSRLHSMIMVNSRVSELAIVNKENGTSIVLTSEGRFASLCSTIEELQQIVHIEGNLMDVQERMIYAATPTKYAASRLYVARELGEGVYLLCGLTDAAWKQTLLANNSGRSYQLEQILCRLPEGQMICLNEEKSLTDMGIDTGVLDSSEPIQIAGRYTLMRFPAEQPAYELIAILTETGATGVASSELFGLVIFLNVLWLLVVVMICIYVLVRIFKPLKEISERIPGEDGEAGMLEKISQAINTYDSQLNHSRLTIDVQMKQLKRAYLRQLALEQNPSMTQEQLEELGIPSLLNSYTLIAIYPDDGRWVQANASQQENSYRNQVTVTAVQELLKTQIQDVQAEFLMLEECLLVIIPVQEDAAEEAMQQRVEFWVMNIGVHMNKRFRFGISKVNEGYESFGWAYHEAMRHAALIEERESGRSEDISLNVLLKQNMNMADLVYMERYEEAFACLKEMIETLAKQKSRHLRSQQLASLLSVTYCMLTETNKTNISLLEQMNLDVSELMKPESEGEILRKWEKVFNLLESHKQQRIHGQYSGQFASIYQYMHMHFRDPDFSLSMLAEKFDMSVSTISREFQKNLGQGFLESLHMMRIDAAKYEIEHTGVPLSDIAAAVGYTNTLTMTRAFKKYMGNTPSTYRKKETPH